MHELEPILKYKMDEAEAKAYKLALMWEKSCEQVFPNERHTKLKKTGDPRKSNLFRYCYKLSQETKGLIPDDEYPLYITAQLHILKTMRDGKIHALIEPCILVGDKAWKRWMVWKKYYDKKLATHKTADELASNTKQSKILGELDRTYDFLMDHFKFEAAFEKLDEKVKNLSMIRWITNGNVSPYYALLSPWLKRSLGNQAVDEALNFDLTLYRPAVTPEVENYFRQKFAYEFI